MYKGKKFFRKGRPAKQAGVEVDKVDFHAEAPAAEKESPVTGGLMSLAYRDLQFHGAIEPLADPNTRVAKGNYPYAIINRGNKVIEANYPGQNNIAGNSLVRLQNSVSSGLLMCFDALVMEKRLNYLYLCLDSNQKNLAFNIESVKAYEQAMSYGYSTMLTQLPFAVDYVVSGMPRGSAGNPLFGQENDAYDRMGALIHYQSVLQNIVSPIAKYTELMSEEQDLMNMSYRREAPAVQELFGQLKKKAFMAKLNALGTTVLSEYFDLNWWKQMNTFRHIPSRKADDMMNPIITVVSSHFVPDLKLYPTSVKPTTDRAGDPYYCYSRDMKYTGFLLNPETYTKGSEAAGDQPATYSFEELILNVNKLLDPAYVLRFVRQLYANALPSGAIQFVSTYYQAVVDYLSAIQYLGGVFSSNMTEIRTFIDKMADTGLVYWQKNIKFNVERVETLDVSFYQVTADVVKASLAGASTMHFDDSTKRWICNTMWDTYLGINKFDNYNGGAFLAFSLRNIDLTVHAQGGGTYTIAENDTARLLPILFAPTSLTADAAADGNETGYNSGNMWVVTRSGIDVHLGFFAATAADFLSNPALSRLNPLATAIAMKIPTWNQARFKERWGSTLTDTANQLPKLLSTLSRTLTQLCGYDQINFVTAESAEGAGDAIAWHVSDCDPDLLCVIDTQFEDVSNQMITFARNYSPFRVATPSPERTQGFGQ